MHFYALSNCNLERENSDTGMGNADVTPKGMDEK